MRFSRSRVRNNAVSKPASQEAQDAFLCPEAGRTLHGVSGQPRHPLCKACPSWSKCASPSTRRHAPGSPREPGSTRFLTSLCGTHLCAARLKKLTSTRVSIRSVFQTMLRSVMPTSLHFFITSSIAESPLVQPSPLQYTRDHAKMQAWSSPATASLIQHLAGLTTDPGTMAQTCST